MASMQMLQASSFPSFHSSYARQFSKPKSPSNLCVQSNNLIKTCILTTCPKSCKRERRFLNLPCASSTFTSATTDEADQETISTTKTDQEPKVSEEKFDWYAQWYPIMPLCDLDKRRPHGKKVMGIDVVAWWDKNDKQWKVFDDRCPHRLAPLSEGRIDPSGRLQCVYHGWCFGGAGDCKLIPQAPGHGPTVHTSKRACVGVYPSYVQNGILWFWPSSDAQYKDIILEKRPPYVPELDDPSYKGVETFLARDLPYGYELLIENLMDPSHVPYAHYTIMKASEPPKSLKVDLEGGRPLDIHLEKLDINGFITKQEFGDENQIGVHHFTPPCLFTSAMNDDARDQSNANTLTQNKRYLIIFFCIPVSPGNSRLIMSAPRNFTLPTDFITSPWIYHLVTNLVIDSDLNLLHIEEKNFMEVGPANWLKTCFVPTKADTNVVLFRRWLHKYSSACGQVDWSVRFSNVQLPPTPHREKLMDRYWSHTVNCKSCNSAYKGLTILELMLQVSSISLIVVAVSKRGAMMAASRNYMVVAILCWGAAKWLSHFIYKTFIYHDYDHATVGSPSSLVMKFLQPHNGLT